MANQITYEQAMAQLTTMFPHVEKDVVAFLLESNKYHVERTVETLLSMTNKPATPVSAAPTSGVSSSSSSSSRSQQEAKHDRPPKIIQTRSGSINLTIQDDFLRPPTYFKRHGGATSPIQHAQDSQGLSQIDQDALLAQMLQDELFMQDLANNPERYMGAEQHAPHPRQPTRSPTSTSPQSGPLQNVTATSAAIASQGNKPDYSGVGSSSNSQDKSFADKWSSLTSAAKAKLANLASKFKSDQHTKQLQESELVGKNVPPNQPYHALSSNLDESLLGSSNDNAPREDDFSLDDDELPTNPMAAGSEVEMKERGPARPARTSQ